MRNDTEVLKELKIEVDELADKMSNLSNFLSSDKSFDLSFTQRHLLNIQLDGMQWYLDALGDRISDLKSKVVVD